MAIELTDDGTMDTVLRCSDCGAEMRYNYDPSGPDAELPTDDHDHIVGRPCAHCDARSQADYDAFVAGCIEDAESEHECKPDDDDDDDEARGPQEDDITTEDHQTFYQSGKRVLWLTAHGVSDDHDRALEVGDRWVLVLNDGRQITIIAPNCEYAVRQYMERTNWFPNCWFISDHGNAHLMDLTEGK